MQRETPLIVLNAACSCVAVYKVDHAGAESMQNGQRLVTVCDCEVWILLHPLLLQLLKLVPDLHDNGMMSALHLRNLLSCVFRDAFGCVQGLRVRFRLRLQVLLLHCNKSVMHGRDRARSANLICRRALNHHVHAERPVVVLAIAATTT